MTKTATLCKRCGKPVPQQSGRGRPRLYCAEGDCATQAKRQRELRRATPGLEGALARAEELYEQIETSLGAALSPLAEALRYECDPAQVEARIAEVRSDAAAAVAAARAERDEVTGRLEALIDDLANARAALDQQAEALEAAESRAKDAVAARVEAIRAAETAREEAVSALAERDAALAAAASAEDRAAEADRERDRALDAANEADNAAAAARGEADAATARADQIAAEASSTIRAAEEALRRADDRAARLENERDTERERAERLLADLAVARRDVEQARGDTAAAQDALAHAYREREDLTAQVRVVAAKLEAAEEREAAARAESQSWRDRAQIAQARLDAVAVGGGQDASGSHSPAEA